jgi:hypothetical protein
MARARAAVAALVTVVDSDSAGNRGDQVVELTGGAA